jgi:type II secretory pathway component PulJ
MSADTRRAGSDSGFVVIGLVVSVVVGSLLAALAAFGLVSATARSTTPVGAPLVTYDSN